MKKTHNILLWIDQILLGTTLIWAAFIKLVQPIEQVQIMWPWTEEVSPAFIKLTGILDVAGGLGVLFPALLRFKPMLTPIAALGVVLLMISACIFHLSRGEASQIGFNVVFGILAAYVAYGRWKLSPIKMN